MKQLLRARELAELLGIRASTLSQWLRTEGIPHIALHVKRGLKGKIRAAYRFDPEEIANWIKGRRATKTSDWSRYMRGRENPQKGKGDQGK